MNIEILFEDSDLLVVNKPSGLSVIPEGWDKKAPNLISLLEPDFGRLWIVHRLDKITSGVYILARNAESHRDINIQFEYRKVIKKYHTILVGVPSWTEYHAIQPLKANSGHSHRTVVDKVKGKQASTYFLVLKSSNGCIIAEAYPETGRTHQIRAHASAVGYPILADYLYGAPPTDIIPRPALHAYSLQFTHPLNQNPLLLFASYPADFNQGIMQLKLEINT